MRMVFLRRRFNGLRVVTRFASHSAMVQPRKIAIHRIVRRGLISQGIGLMPRFTRSGRISAALPSTPIDTGFAGLVRALDDGERFIDACGTLIEITSS